MNFDQSNLLPPLPKRPAPPPDMVGRGGYGPTGYRQPLGQSGQQQGGQEDYNGMTGCSMGDSTGLSFPMANDRQSYENSQQQHYSGGAGDPSTTATSLAGPSGYVPQQGEGYHNWSNNVLPGNVTSTSPLMLRGPMGQWQEGPYPPYPIYPAHRASSVSSNDGRQATGQSSSSSGDQHGKTESLRKRTKTPRACDSCRRKKIRCDIVAEDEVGSDEEKEGNLACVHCKRYNLSCTFFLPITETRWKKSKDDRPEPVEKPYNARPHKAKRISGPSEAGSSRSSRPERNMSGPGLIQSSQHGSSDSPQTFTASPSSSSQYPRESRNKEYRVHGPTSVLYMMHANPTVPHKALEDFRGKHGLMVGRNEAGKGIYRVLGKSQERKIYRGVQQASELFGKVKERDENDDKKEDEDEASKTGEEQSKAKIEDENSIPNPEEALDPKTVRKLIDFYFAEQFSCLPVVSRKDFEANPNTFVTYCICMVAASEMTSAEEADFIKARHLVLKIIEMNDINEPTIEHVQGLLILGSNVDMHARVSDGATAACWTRLGTAVRMAQALGLHLEVVSSKEEEDEYTELRRRIWGGCTVVDGWMSAAYGLPSMIDVHDCDVKLPSPYEIDEDGRPDLQNKRYAPFYQMVKLSLLMGRASKLLYSPTGLTMVTDAQLVQFERDMEQWHNELPWNLRYRPGGSLSAGALHALFTCVALLFYRVFLKITYTAPAHLSFGITKAKFQMLYDQSSESIRIFAYHPELLKKTYFFVYSLVFCAMIQHHCWVRRRDENALFRVKACAEMMKQIASPQYPSRYKTAEILTLLYDIGSEAWEKTQKADPNDGEACTKEDIKIGTCSGVGPDGIDDMTLPPAVGVEFNPRCSDKEKEIANALKEGPQWGTLDLDEPEAFLKRDRLTSEELRHSLTEINRPFADSQNTMFPFANSNDPSLHHDGRPSGVPSGNQPSNPFDESVFATSLNMNPNLNEPMPNMASFDMLMNDGGNASLLEGLPGHLLSFPQWDQYFAGINGNYPLGTPMGTDNTPLTYTKQDLH